MNVPVRAMTGTLETPTRWKFGQIVSFRGSRVTSQPKTRKTNKLKSPNAITESMISLPHCEIPVPNRPKNPRGGSIDVVVDGLADTGASRISAQSSPPVRYTRIVYRVGRRFNLIINYGWAEFNAMFRR